MASKELLNPDSEPAMRRRRAVTFLKVGIPVVLIVGGMLGGYHYEEPFLPHLLGLCPAEVKFYRCENPAILNFVFGLAGGLAFALYMIALHLFVPVRTLLTCRSCKGAGWVRDIEPQGSCPRCRGRRFDAKIWKSGVLGETIWIAPEEFENVEGAELLKRMRAGEPGFV